MVTWGEVKQWQQGPLSDAETALTTSRRDLVACSDEIITMGLPRSWVGGAADEARSECEGLTTDMESLVAQVSAVRRAVIDAADALPGIDTAVEEALAYARDNQLEVGDDGTVTDHYVVPESDGLPSDEPTRGGLVLHCVGLVESALNLAQDVDDALLAVLNDVIGGEFDDVDADSLGDAARDGDVAGGTSPLEPPSGGTPAEVSAWWNSLSTIDRAWLLGNHPDWLGNRDGVPFTVRDEANRAQLADLRGELEAEKKRLDGLAETYSYSNSPTNYDEAVDEINAKLEALDTVEELLSREDHHLLGLDFSNDRAQAIIAQGDFDTAEHLGVFTPGLTSTVGGMGGYDDNLRSMRTLAADQVVDSMTPQEIREAGGYAAAHQAARSEIAVATWLDYQAPQIGSTLSFDNSVAGAGTAEEGGADLADFYRGISTSRADDPDVTAMGHSYGSTTTGYALQQDGIGVDRAALFGSPGLGTSDTGDLNVPSDSIYYGEANRDPVGDLGRFGTDPSALEDIRHFETGDATTSDGRPVDGVTGHTHYLQEGSTSQYNLANLLAGHPEGVIEGDNIGIGDPPGLWKLPWAE